jgi:hypothetical protein
MVRAYYMCIDDIFDMYEVVKCLVYWILSVVCC